jgi:hypothetical protein
VVDESVRGADTGPVTPDAPGVTGTTIISAGGPNLADGNRSPAVTCFVWAWLTRPSDESVAAQWAISLGG